MLAKVYFSSADSEVGLGSRCPPYLQTTTSVQEPDDMTYGMTKATHITLTPDTAALVAFMHSELRPLVEYTAFAVPNNWYSVFRKVYAQASHFPLNIILPESIRRRAIQDLEARQFRIPIESEIQACDDRQTLSKQSDHAFSERVKALQAHRRAQRARIRSSFSDQAFLNRAATVFNVLNAALTKQRDSYYYAARQSTAADAVSCAYLSILLFDGLTKNSAASLLKSRYPRLVEHTERMSKILFSHSPQALSRSEQSRP